MPIFFSVILVISYIFGMCCENRGKVFRAKIKLSAKIRKSRWRYGLKHYDLKQLIIE